MFGSRARTLEQTDAADEAGASRQPLVSYLVLVFAGFWSCLALGYIPTFRFWIPILGAFAPAVASITVLALSEGEPQVRRLVGQLGQWRVGSVWYMAALGIPIVQNACAIGVAAVAGAFSMARVPPIRPVLPAMWLVFLFAAGEELGWRGFALPRLLPRHGPITASLILGMLHAVWHWPVILLPHQYLSGTPLLAFSVFVMSEALVFTWLFQQTRGSVLLAALFHGSSNGAMLFYDGIDPTLGPWLKSSISVLTALVLLGSGGLSLGAGRPTTR